MEHDTSQMPVLPAAMASMAERVAAAVTALAPGVRPIVVDRSQALAGIDRPAVVSILGEPGSGKSTVLHQARDMLIKGSDRLVLPTLTPERFAEGDTLFGWTLAALQDEPALRTETMAKVVVGARDTERTLQQSLDLLRRQEALAASTAKARGAGEAVTPDSLAIQLAAVTSSGVRLAHGWWEFVDALTNGSCTAESQGGLRQVIVMLDDADRSPSALPRLLADLRWLTVHPAVAVVLCASESALFEVLTQAAEISMLSSPLRERHATDTIVKALPRHLRHELRALDKNERLPYHSLDSTGALRDALAEVSLPSPAPVGLTSLLDYFELTVFDTPSLSNYVGLLPGNARRLDQVHRGLRAVLSRGGDSVAGEAAMVLAEAALSAAHAESGLLPKEAISISIQDAKPSVALDLEGIKPGQRIGTGVRLWVGGSQIVGMRRVTGFSTSVINKNDEPTFLPDAFTYALEFIKELAEPDYLPTPAFRWLGMEGEVPKPGGTNWGGALEVGIEGEATDNLFLLVPFWDNLVDYLLYANAWNAIIDGLERRGGAVSQEPISVTWLTFTHIALVSEIQKTRRIPARLCPAMEPGDEPPWFRWSADAAEEDIRTSLTELWEVAPSTMREGDFRNWLALYLPWAADRTFATADVAERVMRLRESIITDDAERESADRRCAASLYRRLQRNLGARWIEGTIELVTALDGERGREISTMHDISRKDRNRSVQGLLDALQKNGVPEELVRRLALHGLTEETASGLQELGLPHQVIAQLAEQLPPVASLKDDAPRPPVRR